MGPRDEGETPSENDRQLKRQHWSIRATKLPSMRHILSSWSSMPVIATIHVGGEQPVELMQMNENFTFYVWSVVIMKRESMRAPCVRFDN